MELSDQETIGEVLEALSGKRILVVGDLMLDRYWWGSVNRISPEAPVPVVSKQGESLVLGGAANVAANLRGLGAKPLVVGVLGSDTAGESIRARLAAAGIEFNGVVSSEDRPTTVKTRIVAHNQQIVRVDEEDASPVGGGDLEALLALLPEAVAESDAVLLSDYAKGCLGDDVLAAIFESSRRTARKVIVDPKGRDYRKYSGAYLLTPNQKETMDATALEDSHPEALEKAGRRMVADLRLGALLITRGEHGMMLLEEGRDTYTLSAAARGVFDVTGAGDTVISVVSAAIAGGADLRVAARVANIAAGIVVEQVGTTAITREMLLLTR